MSTLIYWFRNDLRLLDNPAFSSACANAITLIPVYCHDSRLSSATRWNFPRVSQHRQHFLTATLADLQRQLSAAGSGLLELHEKPEIALATLALRVGATAIYCESIVAPEEQASLAALRAALPASVKIKAVWQSSMLDQATLPFTPAKLPTMFTQFRQAVERARIKPPAALPCPARIPPPAFDFTAQVTSCNDRGDPRSSFPYFMPTCRGGTSAAVAHLAQYFERGLVDSYKDTRNGLNGMDYSSKFSPWLATGALSARTVFEAIQRHEAENGASDGSYWLWFELLWRDYFRFLHWQHGTQLYLANGLAGGNCAPPEHRPKVFERWCRGETGEPLVDAGMRELAATGYLSNRLRQVVASYLIHDLACDWRAGAAWFESQLVDYDVYSNQGNWLYLAGRETDPRGGRRFNPKKQAQDYDPTGAYRKLWGR